MTSDIPVQSSMVVSARYDASAKCLRLFMRDGAKVACYPVSPELYGHFLISESKGRFFKYHLAKLARVESAGPIAEAIGEPAPRPSHQVAEDDCCTKALYRAIATGRLDKAESWTHDKCGCEWRSRLVCGVIQWTPVTYIQVF